MIFKFCFNEQIHRCPKAPTTLAGLMSAVQQTFREALPSNFSVSYIDDNGKSVMITTEEDFTKLVSSSGQENKSVKIYIAPKEEKEVPEQMKSSENSQKDDVQDSYQILGKNDNVEEVQPKSFLDSIPNSDSVIFKRPQVQNNEIPQEIQVQSEPVEVMVEKQPEPEEPSGVIEVSHIKLHKEDAIQEVPVEALQEAPKQQVVEEHKPLYNVEVDKREEIKEPESIKVENVEDDQFIDLSNKKTLQMFIIKTIEEAMPQIMANYLHENKDKKDSPSNLTKIKDAGYSLATNVVDKVSKGVEKIIIGEKQGLSAKLSNVVSILPATISTLDKDIYINITIRNNGTLPFLKNTIIECTSGLNAYIAEVPTLESRKECKVVLHVVPPKKAGTYVTKWRFVYTDQRNMSHHFGEEFEIKLNVEDKKYSQEVTQKAKQLREILPQTSMETFLEFVNQEPNKSFEELVEEFLLNNPSF